MGEKRVVFGTGLGALRAVAALAAAGEPVLWLDPSEDEAIDGDESLELGPWRAEPGTNERLESIVGRLRVVDGRARAVAWGGRSASLPLSPLDRARLVGVRHAARPLGQLLRSRARNAVAEVIGGGIEERSYADWVVRRFGVPVTQRRFVGYAQRRWGQPADMLSASTARWHHFVQHDHQLVVPEEPRSGADRMLRVMHSAGGLRRWGVQLRRLHVENGRVVGIELADGEQIACAVPPWFALDAPALARLLPETALPVDLRVIAERCQSFDRLTVELDDPEGVASQELLVLDDAPFWMVRRAGGRLFAIATIAADAAVDPEQHQQRSLDACHLMGIPATAGPTVRVRRTVGAQPSWSPQSHALLRDLLLAWERLGLVVFGRAGALADLDPLEELRFAVGLAALGPGADQRELQRVHAEPSAREDDVLAPIRPFITR